VSRGKILDVENIDVFYGASQILFGVSLDLLEGQTMALLGRNGAGKSTTLKAIAGLAPPLRGRICVLGSDMADSRPHLIARAGVGFVPEDRQVFPDHTVEDNLEIAQKKGPNGEDYWSLARIFETFPLLLPLRNRNAGNLSGGEQQMLVIARALMGNPIALLLDEPSEGLGPIVVQQIGTVLRRLRDAGASTLIAEQNMHFCLAIASDVTVIDKGQIVYRNTIAGLKANKEIRERYLAI
jgi:branched-chain amino acid transport system ATP-binding protein